MSVKRLAVPFVAVLVLLAIAGVLELLLFMFSFNSQAVADEGMAVAEAKPIVSQVESVIVAQQMAEKAHQNEVVIPAKNLVEAGFITVDGELLDQDRAESLIEAADGFTTRIRYVDQRSILPSGCELVALSVALSAEGIEASPTDIANYLRKGSNVATDYLGDPARNGGGLAPCVVEAGNAWAAEHGVAARVHNLTGTTFDGVLALAKAGYPVITWITERLAEPRYVGTVQNGLQWYRPEHCVVVYGADGEDVLVSDSLEGLVRRNIGQFSHIYEACGNKAALVQL